MIPEKASTTLPEPEIEYEEPALFGLMAEFEEHVPVYPIQNALTAEIRKAAGAANRTGFISMWAGQAAGLSRRRDDGIPAAALVRALADETATIFG